MRSIHFILSVFCFIAHVCVHGQTSFSAQRDSLESELLTKYLSAGGNVDARIDELRESASLDNGHGRINEAIIKLHIALILEEQIRRPSIAVFRLNVFTGDLLSSMDLMYALEYYQKAIAIADSIPSMTAADKFYLYTNTAGIYTDLGDLETGLQGFRKAIQIAFQAEPTSVASGYNNLGVFFQKHNRYDSARVYFHKALDILTTQQMNMALYCAVNDNIAQLNLRDGRYQEALATFRYNDSVYIRTKNLHYKYVPNKNRLLGVMQILSLPGIPDTIQRVQKFVDNSHFIVKANDLKQFYSFAEEYFFKNGDRTKEQNYHRKYVHLTDSLFTEKEEQLHALTKSLLLVQESSLKNEIRSHQLEAEQSRFALKSTQKIGVIILIAIMVTGTVLIMYFRKRRQELQAQKLIAESELRHKVMEAKLIEQELELKKRDLTNLVLHNTQVHDTNLRMIDRLQEITHHKESIDKEVRSLLMDLRSQNQVADKALLLHENIESLNEEFYHNLKSRFPHLSKAEAELCGYLRINLSSKDISILKNVGVPSVKLSKNRLRKKLGITPLEDLYEFIRQI